MSANNHVNCITVSPQQVSTLSSATPTFVSPHHQNMVTVQGQQQQQQQQHQQQGQQQYVLTIQQSPVTTAAAVGCQDSADESKSTALQQVQVLQQQQQQQQHHQMKYAIQTGPNQQTFLAASPQLAQHYAGAQAITLNQQAQPQQPQQAVAYIQGPNGQTFVQQYSPSNATIVGNNQAQVASQQTAQPQLYTPPTIVQNGTQYMIASNNQTGAVLQGYQTVQTATGQQVLIPTMAPAGSSQFISTPMVSQAAVSAPQMNQMVQIVLGNGQTLTTTLANLQAMGINTGISQQYGSYQCANANTYQASVQTQLITNSAGQVFAVTPQMVPNTQTQPSILAAAQNTAQYIQIANPAGGVALMSLQNQHIQQSSTNHAPVATPAPSVQVQPSNPTPESEATRLHVQQIIQQQQQILQQQQQQHHTLTQTATKQIAISEARSEPLHVVHDKSPKEKSNATYQETQMSPANSSGSGTPQPTVSSTTSNKPTSTSSGFSPNAAASQSMDSNPDLISVQSQTSSPASSNGSNMEPESTTQNVNTVAVTISNTDASIVDGVNLEEIKEFARQFKLRRISLGLTQTQVGQALSATEGPSYSQSAICRFEKLDITPKSAQKIKPVLERWMEEAEERYKAGNHTLTDFIGTESNKKRKRRTSFTPAALDILNSFFEKNTHPSGTEMTELAERLNYDREVVRVWFCNKRQALRNTIKRLEPTTVVLA